MDLSSVGKRGYQVPCKGTVQVVRMYIGEGEGGSEGVAITVINREITFQGDL